MISSVIAKFAPDSVNLSKTIADIQQYPGIEIGELVGQHSLPLTIEARDSSEMEATTRWLQTRPHVSFVDVVYVHLADD